ncbi:glycerophosphodiester phosphodiesterase [Bacillus pretiosus]|uniref:glycerophosphodiester phosphodiesterase n=1 Tax=Bacillus pretiosus TaxID=2983392 RepID=UPI003D6495D7
MADAPKLNGNEYLDESYYKINMGIDNSNEALKKSAQAESSSNNAIYISNNAVSKANTAEQKVASVQEQLNQVVVEGSIDPETKQSRIDASGNEHVVLKNRLDNDFLTNANKIDILQQNKRTVLDNFSGTQMVAHRGVMNLAPENTLPAFEIAARYGFEFIEFDISVTSDAVLIINHDDTVDNMTNGTGKISSLTYAQIQSMNVDSGANINVYEGTKLCTFEDVLKVVVKRNLIPFVELKNIVDQTRDCANVYSLLKKYGLTKKAVILTYNKSWLEMIRGFDKDIVLGFLANPWNTANIDYIKSLGNTILVCDRYSAVTENIQYCHDNGVKMAIYSPTGLGSIDLLSEQQEYIKRGVDFILTGSLL